MPVAEVLDPAALPQHVEHVLCFGIQRIEERLMDDRKVIGVGGVLQLNFPVAGEAKAMLAKRLHRIAATLLHEEVDPFARRAEEIDERLDVVLERRKDQPVIFLGTELHETEFAGVEVLRIPCFVRHLAQPAIRVIAPAVIGADEYAGLALALFAHAGGAMAAPVEQRMDCALLVTGDDYRFATDIRGLEAVRCRDVARVRHPNPSVPEDAIHLDIENAGIGIEWRESAVIPHHFCQISGAHALSFDTLSGTEIGAASDQWSTSRENRFSVMKWKIRQCPSSTRQWMVSAALRRSDRPSLYVEVCNIVQRPTASLPSTSIVSVDRKCAFIAKCGCGAA